MVAVPFPIPVTTPDGLTVATLVAPLDQIPPEVTSDNDSIPFVHIGLVPLEIVGVEGPEVLFCMLAVT
jgi:hypothetical protein